MKVTKFSSKTGNYNLELSQRELMVLRLGLQSIELTKETAGMVFVLSKCMEKRTNELFKDIPFTVPFDINLYTKGGIKHLPAWNCD